MWVSNFSSLFPLECLPGLQRLHICVFPDQGRSRVSFSQCEDLIRSKLAPFVQNEGLTVAWEKMNTAWDEFGSK